MIRAAVWGQTHLSWGCHATTSHDSNRVTSVPKEDVVGEALLKPCETPGERGAPVGAPHAAFVGDYVGAGGASSDPCVCLPVFAEGNLYAVGGYDSSSHLATVEKYEPQVNPAW